MATQKDFRVKNGIIVGDSADISNDLTVNSNTLYVDSASGRVGVGTTSPSSKLEVDGTVTATAFSGNLDYNDITNPPTVPSPGDGTLTISAGSGLTGSGTFNADQSSNETITLDVDTSTIATRSYVDTEVSNLVDSSPATLDTLNELAAALGDDPNFATTVANDIGTKADKTTDINAGSGLTGGGDLSADRTISHANTSSVGNVSATSNTFIDGLTFDTFGHVTGVTTSSIGSTTLGPISIETSDTPPASPSDGSLWWDSSDGNLYIYYDDGDSNQWISATAVADGADGINGADGADGEGVPIGGSTGQVLAKSSSNDYDTGWIDISSSSEANATDDTSSSTLYPIMVGGTGSDEVIKASKSNLEFDASSGTLSVTSLTETSSRRYKKNIQNISNALDVVCEMQGVTFDRKDDSSTNESGLIAEELYEIIPSLVALDDEGNPKSVHYTRIIAYLIESIKEQQKQIDELRKSNHG